MRRNHGHVVTSAVYRLPETRVLISLLRLTFTAKGKRQIRVYVSLQKKKQQHVSENSAE